jgi:hypothetical protein
MALFANGKNPIKRVTTPCNDIYDDILRSGVLTMHHTFYSVHLERIRGNTTSGTRIKAAWVHSLYPRCMTMRFSCLFSNGMIGEMTINHHFHGRPPSLFLTAAHAHSAVPGGQYAFASSAFSCIPVHWSLVTNGKRLQYIHVHVQMYMYMYMYTVS